MSEKTGYICDQCGHEIPSESRRINIRGNLEIYGPAIEEWVEVNLDLCLACAKDAFEANMITVPIEAREKVDFEAE